MRFVSIELKLRGSGMESHFFRPGVARIFVREQSGRDGFRRPSGTLRQDCQTRHVCSTPLLPPGTRDGRPPRYRRLERGSSRDLMDTVEPAPGPRQRGCAGRDEPGRNGLGTEMERGRAERLAYSLPWCFTR